jgi:hypothetical protein
VSAAPAANPEAVPRSSARQVGGVGPHSGPAGLTLSSSRRLGRRSTLHAILRLYTVQEDETYLSLGGSVSAGRSAA